MTVNTVGAIAGLLDRVQLPAEPLAAPTPGPHSRRDEMKRILFTLAALVLTAACADAGPIRDRLAARFGRHANTTTCNTCTQPGPVQTVAANVLTTAGQVVQTAGQVVYQFPQVGTFRPTTCSGGVCR